MSLPRPATSGDDNFTDAVKNLMKVLQGEFKEGDTVVVDAEGDQLTFRAGVREPVAAG
jgi:hypothetical protein